RRGADFRHQRLRSMGRRAWQGTCHRTLAGCLRRANQRSSRRFHARACRPSACAKESLTAFSAQLEMKQSRVCNPALFMRNRMGHEMKTEIVKFAGDVPGNAIELRVLR